MEKDEMIKSYGFSTKAEMLASLQAYLKNPDDDSVRLKDKIKEKLLSCPKLLWALHVKDFEEELFNEDGTLNDTGDWDVYYGDTSVIRPFLFIPETQDVVTNYLCYQVSSDENMRFNPSMKYMVITFTIFIHEKDSIDKETGIARHDLIGSILRELMAWTSTTIAHAIPVFEGESVTDTNYITKVLKYQVALPNNLVVTENTPVFVNKTKR